MRDVRLMATFILSMLAMAALLAFIAPAVGFSQWPIWTQQLLT
jgi:hypothetical protein